MLSNSRRLQLSIPLRSVLIRVRFSRSNMIFWQISDIHYPFSHIFFFHFLCIISVGTEYARLGETWRLVCILVIGERTGHESRDSS